MVVALNVVSVVPDVEHVVTFGTGRLVIIVSTRMMNGLCFVEVEVFRVGRVVCSNWTGVRVPRANILTSMLLGALVIVLNVMILVVNISLLTLLHLASVCLMTCLVVFV